MPLELVISIVANDLSAAFLPFLSPFDWIITWREILKESTLAKRWFMPEQKRNWKDILWPLGGTLLGLLVVPLAIAQYPQFFNENSWVLPLSVVAVLFCWVFPLLVHARTRKIYSHVATIRFGYVILFLLSLGTAAGLFFGGRMLFRFHNRHLRESTAASATQQQRPATPSSNAETTRIPSKEIQGKPGEPAQPSNIGTLSSEQSLIKDKPFNHRKSFTQSPISGLQEPSLNFKTYVINKPYPDGMVIGGIPWKANFVDVRLDIAVGSVQINKFDVVLGLDTSIAGVGQISQFPGFIALPAGDTPAMWLEGTDEKGNPVSIPAVPTYIPGTSIAPVYRVRCETLFSSTVLHLVIASIALNSPNKNGTLPNQLLAARRVPTGLELQGQYEVKGKVIPVRYLHHFTESEESGVYE